jgi:hypothetical protein
MINIANGVLESDFDREKTKQEQTLSIQPMIAKIEPIIKNDKIMNVSAVT